MKFSIIVPVYNAEKYIKKCIDSIISQTYKDFELIIVNDGSTDNSENILLQYKSNLNVRIITTQNQGVAKARWEGINNASGKYIMFVDSDDYVSPQMLDVIDNQLDEDIDLLQFSYISFTGDKAVLPTNSYAKSVIYDKQSFLEKIVDTTIVNGSEAIVLWNKVYMREKIIENVKVFPYSFLEDYIFNCEYYISVNKYKRISDCLYFYRSLPDSLSKKVNPNGFEILKYVDNLKSNVLKKMDFFTLDQKQNSAAWFINYLYNLYLFNACAKNSFTKTRVLQILSDEILLEKCLLVKGSKYDSDIAAKIRNKKYINLFYLLKFKSAALNFKKFIKSKV